MEHLPFKFVDHVNDPKGELYAAFDLKKGTLKELVGPAVWRRGLEAFFKGNLPGKVGNDVRQLPGTFLVYHGKIVSAFRSRHSGDHPDLDAIAAEFRSQHHA